MTAPSDAVPRPPGGAFSVWQRLLRGYGPLAVLVVILLLVAWLVPSKAPTIQTGDAGVVDEEGDVSGPGDSTGTTGGGDDGAPGTVPSKPDTQGAPPANTSGCPDRKAQVPGDPYSPPCIAWSGSNGGATARGVTADSIDVAFRVLDEKGFQQTLAELAGATLVDTPESVRNTVEALAEYFNQSFQFYGRTLNFRFYEGKGSNTQELLGSGVDKAVADAETVKTMNVFGDLSATSEPYGDALSDRQIVNFGVPYLSRQWHSSRRPYAWSLATDCTILAEEVAEYTISRLAGGNADWAGGDLKGKPRKIIGIAPENEWYQQCVHQYRDYLKERGVDIEGTLEYRLDLGTLSNQAKNLVPRLKQDGITTVICGCDPVMPVFFSGEAASQEYFPEFVTIGAALVDRDFVGQLYNQEFTKHAFGISALDDSVEQPPTSTIAYQAFKRVRPNEEPAFTVDLIYYQMYMLAIGVQMAGPNLTPTTFESGMFNYPAKFGNAGLWDFAPGDYTPQDDVREVYWDPDTVSPYNGKPGAWVNPSPGKRYFRGQVPNGEPPFPQPG